MIPPPRRYATTLAVSALTITQIGAGLPAVNYSHIDRTLDLPTGYVGLMFATLIFGIAATLSYARRNPPTATLRTLVIGLCLASSGDLLLLIPHLTAVTAGHLMLGSSIGVCSVAAPGIISAHLNRATQTGALVTIANGLGLAAGPALGVLLLAVGPNGYATTFTAHALACLALAATAAAAARPAHPHSVVIHRPTVTARHLPPLRPGPRVTPLALTGFFAFVLGSIVSSMSAIAMPNASATAGLTIATFYALNTLGGLAAYQLRTRALTATATTVAAGICALIAWALADRVQVLLLIAVGFLGAAQGILISLGVAASTQLDTLHDTSAHVSTYFLCAYVGAAAGSITASAATYLVGSAAAYPWLLASSALIASIAGIRTFTPRTQHRATVSTL